MRTQKLRLSEVKSMIRRIVKEETSSYKKFTANDLANWKVGDTKDWKFGLITREVTKDGENKFTIDDTSSGWMSAQVDAKTLLAVTNGEMDYSELDWN